MWQLRLTLERRCVKIKVNYIKSEEELEYMGGRFFTKDQLEEIMEA